jgi:hypothetical protein
MKFRYIVPLLFLLIVPFLYGQTITLPGMPETTTIAPNDLLWVWLDPAGANATRKIKASNLLAGPAIMSRQFPMAGVNGTTASSIWDLPAANGCVAAVQVPATNVIGGVLQCAVGQTAELNYVLENNWTGAIDASLVLAGGGSDTSGTIIPTIAIGCSPTNGTATDNPNYNTADNMSTITLATAANRLWTSTKTGITTTGCIAGNLMHIKIGRASSTAVSPAQYKSLTLTVRRTP